jgi:hypothetical protein
MVEDDLVTHYETPGEPYYTTAGDQAARNSNIEVNSTTDFTDAQAIDWWMQAPFHAMGMLDPRLLSSGFGSYRRVKSGWESGFAVDVIRGNTFTGGTVPVEFPGNGSTMPLRSYDGNEFPNPLQACPGYSAPSGLPIWIEIGGNVKTTVTASSITTGTTQLPHCNIDGNNSALSSYLYTRGGAILIPQQPLQTGATYNVSMTVNNVVHSWSFTVGAFVTQTVAPPAGWTSLGGLLTASPAASSWAANRVDVFVTGSDNALYQRTWNGSSWSAWTGLGGGLTAGPGAVSWGPNRIDVFVRGNDEQLYHRYWTGAWSSWEALGGLLTSSPAAASWSAGRLDVFVRGSDNALYHKVWTGSAWSAWESLGGGLASDPGAVSSTRSRIDVVVRGTDNAVWIRSFTGASWTAWTSLGGAPASAPQIASCAAGHLDVYYRGADGALYHSGFNGTAWGAWTKIGGGWSSNPAAVCPPGGSTIDVFERGLDYALWQGTAAAS